MEKYAASEMEWSVQTVRVTLQYQNLIGHIAYRVFSNMAGLALLQPDIEFEFTDPEWYSRLVENDCQFDFSEANETFRFELHDENGEGGGFCIDIDELAEFIVALEIIDAREYDPETGMVS